MDRKMKLLTESNKISTELYLNTSINKHKKIFNDTLFIELSMNDYIYLVRKEYRTPQIFKVLERISSEEIIISNEIDELKINTLSYNIDFYEGSFLIVEI